MTNAQYHVQNLPPGSIVRSPDDAHVRQMCYELTNEDVEIGGFYSKSHQGIFTHHDSFLHMQLITADRTKMGHLYGVEFAKGMRLFIPK